MSFRIYARNPRDGREGYIGADSTHWSIGSADRALVWEDRAQSGKKLTEVATDLIDLGHGHITLQIEEFSTGADPAQLSLRPTAWDKLLED